MRRGLFFKNPLFYKDRQLYFDTRFFPDKGNSQAKPLIGGGFVVEISRRHILSVIGQAMRIK